MSCGHKDSAGDLQVPILDASGFGAISRKFTFRHLQWLLNSLAFNLFHGEALTDTTKQLCEIQVDV
jgi:hypothetical protein